MAAIGPFCRTSRTVRTRSAASLFERMPEWNLALRARTSANSVESLRPSRGEGSDRAAPSRIGSVTGSAYQWSTMAQEAGLTNPAPLP